MKHTRFDKLIHMSTLCLSGMVTLCVSHGQALAADLTLPSLFSDHMVLQQDVTAPVWGWANPGDTIRVSVGGTSATAKTNPDGRWMVRLDKLPTTTTPVTLTIASTTKTITINDVLVGDVWLCSGQSNMAMTMNQGNETNEALPKANYPSIRYFAPRAPKRWILEPVTEIDGRWVVCTPETAARFSAVGYFFISELAQHVRRPLGLICSSWSGTTAQEWTSLKALTADPALKTKYADPLLDKIANADKVRAAHAEWLANGGAAFKEAMRKYDNETHDAKVRGEKIPPPPTYPTSEPFKFEDRSHVTSLFNTMIYPLMPYAITGVLWYQGESNNGDELYHKLFSAMIRDWRQHWGQGDFPFLFVQLPNYTARSTRPADAGGITIVREQQVMALSVTPRTGMAVSVDCGDPGNIHPAFKSAIGRRLSLLARRMVYGEDILASGPTYVSQRVDGNKISLKFSNVGTGLKLGVPPKGSATPLPSTTEVKGFAIAGANKKFFWATATLAGSDTVIVNSDQVSEPTMVRYAWENNPEVNLYNSADLPPSPFRTDMPTPTAP